MNKKNIQNIAWAALYTIWTVGAFMFTSLVLVGLPVYYLAGQNIQAWLETPLGTLTLAAFIYAATAVIAISPLIIRRLPKDDIRNKLGLSEKPTLSMVQWAAITWGLYFVATIIVTGILYFINLPGVNLEQKQNIGLENLSGGFGYVAAFLLLVVVAPFFEELLFRGYLFGQIRERNGFWLSAIVTSLAFGALHGQLNVGIDTFILSLFICYLRERFHSIWPGVFVHAFKNGLAYVILFILPLYGFSLV